MLLSGSFAGQVSSKDIGDAVGVALRYTIISHGLAAYPGEINKV